MQVRIHGTVDGIYSQLDMKADVRLREKIHPLAFTATQPPRSVGSFITLSPENTVVEVAFQCRGDGLSCEGGGTTTVSGEEYSGCSAIWINNSGIDVSSQYQFSVPRTGIYSVCLSYPDNAQYDVVYRNEGGTNTVQYGYISPVIGRHPVLTQQQFLDPQTRTFEGGVARMAGSFSMAVGGAFQTLDVSWSICREGVACSAPPPLPPGGDGDPDRPDDVAEEEDDDCANLARLIAGMRALREAYEMHEAAFVEAEQKRNIARDAIYGFSGTLSKFFLSLGSFASEALTGPIGDLVGLIGSGLGLVQENSGDNVAQAVIGIADTDIAFSPAETTALRDAIRKADAVLKETGSDSSALRTYANEVERSEALRGKGQNVVKGVSIVVSASDYIEKTNGLANSIQEYFDYKRETDLHQASMNETQDLMADKQAEIDEARVALDGPCPGIPSTRRRDPARAPSSPYVLVQSGPAGSEPPATADEVREIVAAVSRVEARMASAAPWLLPFFARATDAASPELLRALLRRAETDLRAAKAEAEAAVEAGRDLERRFGTVTSARRAVPESPRHAAARRR